jgi:hypothetical protein
MQRERSRLGRVWQNEYFYRIVRDDEELTQKLNYIMQNPSQRWPEMGEYSWLWSLDL